MLFVLFENEKNKGVYNIHKLEMISLSTIETYAWQKLGNKNKLYKTKQSNQMKIKANEENQNKNVLVFVFQIVVHQQK